MGERLSTASSPPEPDGAAPEPRLPATETQPPLPTVSGRTPRPQQEDEVGPPPAEAQGQEAGDGGGAPLEEGPCSEAPSSNSYPFALRPVYPAVTEESPSPPPTSGEEGRQEDPTPAVSPPPSSQPSVVGAGGKGTPSGNVEVDLYLLPESFSGLISGTLLVLPCRVCLEEKPLKPLPCCKKPVCEACLKRYLSSQVQVGQADIPCPITECNEHLDETTILFNLPHDDIIKYKYFLELGRIGSGTKPCPQCKHFTTFKRKGHIPNPTRMENKYKIQCPTCQFVWCFKCHSPWHEGVNCKEFKKGDKLLRHWASEIEHGQRNAQKCPKCKIHIQRTEGCDHMTCSQCNTNFCYRCGERYRQLRFFGDHTSNLSVFGCKYRYLPGNPHLRRFVRGSVCGGKLLIAPVILVLGLVVGAVVVLIGKRKRFICVPHLLPL
ncbi:probable E3 ubiquitin-protein ligase RNF217 isoform X2 [Notechis scutatus]|uniref:E3 ubiquitin-protein ligase RNF217 n=1 Tax=Notechis scutatus TaxID=8663 RepID=A0A6J1TZP0_9SAUR|nr:probable E3 ubiquitin-protein ligase RNF217 isoform X2 [Notechis scutatus]